jgi:hypothetical protein
MITTQIKNIASPLSLAVESKSSTSKSDSGSFSALLHSLSSKTDTPAVKNSVLTLHLDEKKELPVAKTAAKGTKTPNDSKNTKEPVSKSDLLSLLKGDEQKIPTINPALTEAVDPKTLKSIMKDAKNYLKEQIKETDAFKKGEIKELPKTTQGLVALAKKVGIDVSKITVETVQTKSIKEPKVTPKSDKIDTKSDVKAQSKVSTEKIEIHTPANDSKTTTTPSSVKDDKNLSVAKSDVKTEDIKSTISKESTALQTKTDTNKTPVVQTEPTTPISKNDLLKDDKTLHVTNNTPQKDISQKETIETPKTSATKDTTQTQTLTQDDSIKKMPLFVMPDETVSSHSTAELVNKKQVKSPQEQPTANLQSPLSALLHGDKTLSSQTQITDTKKDSKIETKTDTKIKANSTILSQLLHGENQQTTQTATQTTSEVNVSEISSTAGNSLHVKQTEADLTVKMNEAKQMVKYLAQDIKQAIEDYKPPFTRIKVKLNPQKFGEVDLTVVQRGKNVHVNISSNSAAINMLSQNSGDLKTQLTQNGMNNASVNFNSSSDSQGQQQQQNGHQKESAKKAYEAFTQDETNEEILSSLEIVVPQYI